MAKKRKPTKGQAGKQSREQLLNQKNGGVPLKKQPSDGNAQGSSNGTISISVNPVPNTCTVQPQPKPIVAPACTHVHNQTSTVSNQSSTAPAATPSQQPACAIHPQNVTSLPSPNGPLPAPPTVNSWMQVFKMLPAERQTWFEATPGAEATYTMIIENAKRKHSQSVADKAKAAQQGGVGGVQPQGALGGAQPQTTGMVASIAPAHPVQHGPSVTAGNSAGPSRAALPAFTSPIPTSNGLSIPQNIPARPASTPVTGSAPTHLPVPQLATPTISGSASAPPITAQGLALELERLRAENLQIKALMASIKGALDSECARRGLQPLDIIPAYLGGNGKTTPEEAARMQLGAPGKGAPTPLLAATTSAPSTQAVAATTNGPTTQALRDLQASKDVQELRTLRNELSIHTETLENVATELLSLKADLETARKENTRLGLNSFKNRAEREALLRDKARLQAEVQQLGEVVRKGRETRVGDAEETKRLREQAEASKREAETSRQMMQDGEKERKRLKIRLDAVKLLVLQDDVDDLDPLNLGRQLIGLGTGTQPPADPNIRYLSDNCEQSVSSLPALPDSLASSIGSLAESGRRAPTEAAQSSDPAVNIATRWSRTVMDRARSQESLKLLKVAWKLAAFERVVMKPAVGVREPTSGQTEKEKVSEDVKPDTDVAGLKDVDGSTMPKPVRGFAREPIRKPVNPGKQEQHVVLSTESAQPSSVEAEEAQVSKVDESARTIAKPVLKPPAATSTLDLAKSGQDAKVKETKEIVMNGNAVTATSVKVSLDEKPQVLPTKSAPDETPPSLKVPSEVPRPTQTNVEAEKVTLNVPPPTEMKVETEKPPQHPTTVPPSWSRAKQVLVAQSDDDSSSSDDNNPDMIRLLTRIPHLIEHVRLGRLSQEGIISLRKLLKMKRSAIIRWYKGRNLPSPYDDLPACLQQSELSDTSVDSSSDMEEDVEGAGTQEASPALPDATVKPAANNISVTVNGSSPGPESAKRTAQESATPTPMQLADGVQRNDHVAQREASTVSTTAFPSATSSVNSVKAQRDNIVRAVMMRMVSERLQINKIRQKRRIAATTHHMRQSRKAFRQVDSSESEDTTESDTSDYSDAEADKEIFSRHSFRTVSDGKKEVIRNSFVDLPDEVIDEIVFYLKPRFVPREETYGAMRVATWEQDEVFDPCWGKDLFGLATSCRRFYNLLYDTQRLNCVQVIDSEEGIKSMIKSIPDDKKELVRTVIIGNNLRVDDNISAPAYLDLLDVFPRLTAIQHHAWCPSVSGKMLAEPFDFTPLEALDLFVPDTLCDPGGPPPPSWPRTQVKSLTLREYRWWMLYTEVTFGTVEPNQSALYFDFLCKHFKGVKQLNLFPHVIADSEPFVRTLEKLGERTRSWMTRGNLPEVERVNIRLDAAYKIRREDICSLPRIEYMLTDLSPTLRHVRVAVDLRHPDATRIFMDTLHPLLSPPDSTEYWAIITEFYIPSPGRIKEFARTLAKYMTALETIQFVIYNHDSTERPMFQYDAKVVRVRKSEPGKPGSFRLLEKMSDRLAELVAQNR
ncbi:hypothetical protein QFC21_005852 [Naganishia friedmannii]|uniref:Uncharacterized protein n=1 Tax=Naganishia friedmannii TaxID=89922 RepID=A0ACC2V711_9TREE|nr:hypothetical protein QFC21_005852 [Naganishia friedmannii]